MGRDRLLGYLHHHDHHMDEIQRQLRAKTTVYSYNVHFRSLFRRLRGLTTDFAVDHQ